MNKCSNLLFTWFYSFKTLYQYLDINNIPINNYKLSPTTTVYELTLMPKRQKGLSNISNSKNDDSSSVVTATT